MNKASIGLIVDSKITQWSLGAIILWHYSTWLFLLGHVSFDQHRPDWQYIDLVLVFHLNGSWQKVVVHFGCWVVWYVRNWVLSRKWRNIDDRTSLLSFEHQRNNLMAHHCHWNDVDVDFIHYSLVWNLVKISNVRNTYIVDQHRYVQALKFLKNFCEKIRILTLSKICYNCFCLNWQLIIQVLDFLQSLLHFVLISGNHANIKT